LKFKVSLPVITSLVIKDLVHKARAKDVKIFQGQSRIIISRPSWCFLEDPRGHGQASGTRLVITTTSCKPGRLSSRLCVSLTLVYLLALVNKQPLANYYQPSYPDC